MVNSKNQRKLAKVADKYDLEHIEDNILDSWVSRNKTLSELRDMFNQAVLEAAMEQAGMNISPGEVEYTYKYIFDQDNNTTHTHRKEMKAKLTRNGVSVDDVVDDFINSPQTILNYLRDIHNVDRVRNQHSDGVSIEKSKGHIKPLNKRYEQIAEGIIDSMIKKGRFDDAEFDVEVECTITNTETNETTKLMELLDRPEELAQ